MNLIGSSLYERASINTLREKFIFKIFLLHSYLTSAISLNSCIAWELCFPIVRSAGFISFLLTKMQILGSEKPGSDKNTIIDEFTFPSCLFRQKYISCL